MVGERHPDVERRSSLHGHGHRSGRHRCGPHLARQLRGRRRPGWLQPDARQLDGSSRVYGNDDENLRQLREQHRTWTGIEVDEPERVPIDPSRRAAPSRDPRRDVQPVQLGELRFPGGEYLEPGHVRTDYELDWRSARGPTRTQVLLLTFVLVFF